tara:strand:+ start:208099 stop:209016 length:918 start_codon:yes stop_codon:yes gene_type:complete
MENYKEQLQNYLKTIEEFLTSVLLEETDITISDFEPKEAEAYFAEQNKDDIYLFAYDANREQDVIAILDNEWFGLLSSIMLGVEEKTFNEVTKDLLEKFSSELSGTLIKKLTEDGIETAVEKVEVTQLKKLPEFITHTAYFEGKIEVEGLADDKVKARILIGDPEAKVVIEEPEEEPETEAADKTEEKVPNGVPEEVISGKYVEFDEFDETTLPISNESGKSMDVLKDVEMDLSVELGRIEMPLGRILQLTKGSVIELEKLAGEPIDILVNGLRIATGEVVVIDEHFGVRVSNLITTRQQLAKLN